MRKHGPYGAKVLSKGQKVGRLPKKYTALLPNYFGGVRAVMPVLFQHGQDTPPTMPSMTTLLAK